MKNNKNLFWGFFFILCAVFVLLRQLGFYTDISLIKLLLTIGFASVIINGVKHCNFFSILVPSACLFIMYDDVLGFDDFSPFSLICAAIFAAIGLQMIFPKKHHHIEFDGISKREHFDDKQAQTYEEGQGGNGTDIRFQNLFGSCIKYANSNAFTHADLECTFGCMTVYFDNAVIQGNTAYIHVDVTFGTLVLYLPSTWQVEDDIDAVFGGTRYQNPIGNPIGPKVVITGDVVFSSVTVKYI